MVICGQQNNKKKNFHSLGLFPSHIHKTTAILGLRNDVDFDLHTSRGQLKKPDSPSAHQRLFIYMFNKNSKHAPFNVNFSSEYATARLIQFSQTWSHFWTDFRCLYSWSYHLTGRFLTESEGTFPNSSGFSMLMFNLWSKKKSSCVNMVICRFPTWNKHKSHGGAFEDQSSIGKKRLNCTCLNAYIFV